VPYKGSGPAIIEVIAGQVQLTFDSVPAVIQHVQSKKLRAIAVTSGKRFEGLPNVPTISESGMPGFDMSTWWGLVMPAGVNKEIITKVNSATVKLLHTPGVKLAIANVGAEVVGNSSEEFTAYIASERVKYEKIIKSGNIKMD
jgi:tripartite-type tricarboxylate transporter receptor subunit TctC